MRLIAYLNRAFSRCLLSFPLVCRATDLASEKREMVKKLQLTNHSRFRATPNPMAQFHCGTEEQTTMDSPIGHGKVAGDIFPRKAYGIRTT